MLVNQPAILPGAFAAEGNKNTIPANNDGLSGLASIAKGFPPITQVPLAQGGQPPQRQDFNGIFNLFSNFLLFAQNGGVYAYNNTLDYQPPCIISYHGEFYSCLQKNGPSTSAGVQPVTNTTYWEKLIPDVAVMKGASGSAAGASGLVPAPARNQQGNFLTGAGVWRAIATTEQARAGTDDSAPMTALKVKQAINALTNAIPIGTILPFAGGTIPSGFLACNGAAVSRTTYSALFSAIGTTYGGGNGSTTFNLPNIAKGKLVTGGVSKSGTATVYGNGQPFGLTQNGSELSHFQRYPTSFWVMDNTGQGGTGVNMRYPTPSDVAAKTLYADLANVKITLTGVNVEFIIKY